MGLAEPARLPLTDLKDSRTAGSSEEPAFPRGGIGSGRAARDGRGSLPQGTDLKDGRTAEGGKKPPPLELVLPGAVLPEVAKN